MYLNQINKRKLFYILIIAFIFSILLKQINFFRDIYFLSKYSFKERLLKTYGFCNYESLGFLDFIKDKYNINYRLPIVTFGKSPNPYWYWHYLDFKESSTNKIILLNYNNLNDGNYNVKNYYILEKIDNCYFLDKK